MSHTVTIIIPSYNHDAYVGRAISSVFEQTYEDIELVIVDDGSSDNSRKVIRDVIKEAGGIAVQYIEQENAGAHAAIMRGIEVSHGRFISILNSDDYYLPDRLRTMLPLLESSVDSIAFSKVRLVDEDNNQHLSDSEWPKWYSRALNVISNNPTIGFSLLVHNFSVTSGNFLFSRLLYEKVGGFSEHKFLHDWDFLIRATYYTEPIFVPEELMAYRIHDSNTTESVRHLLYEEAREVLTRYFRLCKEADPPNKLAPCATNWPHFFPTFCRTRKAFFDDSELGKHIHLENLEDIL